MGPTFVAGNVVEDLTNEGGPVEQGPDKVLRGPLAVVGQIDFPKIRVIDAGDEADGSRVGEDGNQRIRSSETLFMCSRLFASSQWRNRYAFDP